MVDWSLARQVARLAAGSGDEGPPQADVVALCVEMEQHVAGYTGLAPATTVPAAELVGRGDWASVNLDSLGRLLDPVAARLEQRLEFAGPLAGALKAGASATLAAEAGLVIGYVAQRVLGQYEVSLLGGDAPPRLLFVAPNLRKAVRELKVDPEPFHRWICAHELTHVYQFQGVDWLREHLGGMVRQYLTSVEVRIDRGAAGGLPSEAIPGHEGLRIAMDARRRSRSAPQRLIEGLLGLDMKMRQYEQGKVFCDAVVAEGGMDALNRVWASPESLPTPLELEHPLDWLARVGPAPAAAAS